MVTAKDTAAMICLPRQDESETSGEGSCFPLRKPRDGRCLFCSCRSLGPTGQHGIARGNAPGLQTVSDRALKGRNKNAAAMSPLQGSVSWAHSSRGDAPGYHMLPLWGKKRKAENLSSFVRFCRQSLALVPPALICKRPQLSGTHRWPKRN